MTTPSEVYIPLISGDPESPSSGHERDLAGYEKEYDAEAPCRTIATRRTKLQLLRNLCIALVIVGQTVGILILASSLRESRKAYDSLLWRSREAQHNGKRLELYCGFFVL
jgi:hypothetical protein